MKIHKSAEDYLEMILMLTEQKGYARSIDIAAGLSVSKPSVSYAMKQLRENGYITMDKDNFIHLTESGGDEATAREDACKIEHDISDATFEAITKYVK